MRYIPGGKGGIVVNVVQNNLAGIRISVGTRVSIPRPGAGIGIGMFGGRRWRQRFWSYKTNSGH